MGGYQARTWTLTWSLHSLSYHRASASVLSVGRSPEEQKAISACGQL